MKKLLAVFVLLLSFSTAFSAIVYEDIGNTNNEIVKSITVEQNAPFVMELQAVPDLVIKDHVVYLKTNQYKITSTACFIDVDYFKPAAIHYNYFNRQLLNKPDKTTPYFLQDLSITNYWYRNYKS